MRGTSERARVSTHTEIGLNGLIGIFTGAFNVDDIMHWQIKDGNESCAECVATK